MISPQTIKEYLNKPLENYSFVKDMPTKIFIDKLEDFDFKTKPFSHQLKCTYLGSELKNFLFLLDMGTGKTKITLDILSNHKKNSSHSPTLILSPNVSTVATWTEETEKHSDLTSIELVGETNYRWRLLEENKDKDLILLNYTGLLYMVTDAKPTDKGDKNKRVVDRTKLKKFLSYFENVVYDEIHACKNHMSLTFKVCKEISKHSHLRYGLTGTPINRDPLPLWSQFYLIDLGETLGETLTIYRESFFNSKPGYFGGMDYKFKKEYESLLTARLGNRSIRYAEKEIQDLPERVESIVSVIPSAEIQEYYDKVQVKSDEFLEIKNAFIKLRQICSGFLQFKNDDGTESCIEIKDNPKLDTLVELIKATPHDAKVLVFLDYIKSGEIISARLDKEKIKHERLYGGTKDKVGTKNKFINSRSCKVLVANTQSAGMGLNLQAANYVIYYESPLSSIMKRQSLKRVHRTGQTKRVFIYSLITKGTIEEKIEHLLKEGKDIFKALIDGVLKLKKKK